MSATDHPTDDILIVSDALRDWEDDWSGTRSLAEAVLDAIAPIVARERRRAEAAEQRAGAFEAALTEERAMAHETIRALQAEVASAEVEALRDAARDLPGFDGIRTHGDAARWLRYRAHHIERAATEARS